ncbi:hypothetical protein O5282_26980 [Escherichia coli]|nr:hypothetical protein [Escherichia coli]
MPRSRLQVAGAAVSLEASSATSSQGLIDEIPLVIFLTILFQKNRWGPFKQHKGRQILQ